VLLSASDHVRQCAKRQAMVMRDHGYDVDPNAHIGAIDEGSIDDVDIWLGARLGPKPRCLQCEVFGW